MIRKPVKWRTFQSGSDTWTIMLTTHRLTRSLQKDSSGGPYVGRAMFGRKVIYVDIDQPLAEIYETIFHELMHVGIRDLDLPLKLDEEITDKVSKRLSPLFLSVAVTWPPFPDEVQKHIQEKGQCS